MSYTNTLTETPPPAGTFEVTEHVEDPDAVAGEVSFGFSWRCTAPDGTEYPESEDDGTFSLTAEETWESPSLPEGSDCTVRESLPRPELDAEHGWHTATSIDDCEPEDGLAERFTVPAGSGEPAVSMDVTNTVVPATQTGGQFTVTKELDDPDGAVPADQEFTYTWRCTTGGDAEIPEDGPGEFTLAPATSGPPRCCQPDRPAWWRSSSPSRSPTMSGASRTVSMVVSRSTAARRA